jgi:hypothetical protein
MKHFQGHANRIRPFSDVSCWTFCDLRSPFWTAHREFWLWMGAAFDSGTWLVGAADRGSECERNDHNLSMRGQFRCWMNWHYHSLFHSSIWWMLFPFQPNCNRVQHRTFTIPWIYIHNQPLKFTSICSFKIQTSSFKYQISILKPQN